MTTKKKLEEPEMRDVKGSVADYCHIEFLDNDNEGERKTLTTTTAADDKDVTYYWKEAPNDRKTEVAVDVMMKLLDFNHQQLARTDTNSVMVYNNPAEYAAEIVNELFEKIGRE
jgi:hypothetical protein